MLLIQKTYNVAACVEEASVVITVQAADTATGFVLCIINITSALMRTHPFHYYNGLYALGMYPISAGLTIVPVVQWEGAPSPGES